MESNLVLFSTDLSGNMHPLIFFTFNPILEACRKYEKFVKEIQHRCQKLTSIVSREI